MLRVFRFFLSCIFDFVACDKYGDFTIPAASDSAEISRENVFAQKTMAEPQTEPEGFLEGWKEGEVLVYNRWYPPMLANFHQREAPLRCCNRREHHRSDRNLDHRDSQRVAVQGARNQIHNRTSNPTGGVADPGKALDQSPRFDSDPMLCPRNRRVPRLREPLYTRGD